VPSVVPTTLTLAAESGSPDPSTVTRPLTLRVCAKALALNRVSSSSENTNGRILVTPVSCVGFVEARRNDAAGLR
jgi:hypothetical protein